MKSTVGNIVWVAVGLVLLVASEVVLAASPTEQLKPVLEQVVAVLSNPEYIGDENKVARRAKIMEEVKKGFDFREMSRRVLGPTWKKISDEERTYFTEIMTKLLENVYIGKFEGYSGNEIIYSNERLKGDRAQVTTLVDLEGAQVPIHYIMKNKNDKWMVYDINVEGVSLVRNYKEQFKSILRKEKYDGLVKVIEDKNEAFKTEENQK